MATREAEFGDLLRLGSLVKAGGASVAQWPRFPRRGEPLHAAPGKGRRARLSARRPTRTRLGFCGRRGLRLARNPDQPDAQGARRALQPLARGAILGIVLDDGAVLGGGGLGGGELGAPLV